MALPADEIARPLQAYGGSYVSQAVPNGSCDAGASATDSTLERNFSLLRSVGEECQTEAELKDLLQRKANKFVLYDGFEPSGRMHIAQGLFKAINVNKCTEAGGTFKFWVADWFGLMNDKMGGDLEKIRDVGKYFVHVWKSCGMRMENVQFIWTSEFIQQNATEYWTKMLDISRVTSMWRIKKCCTIMGRGEGNLTAAQILYPLMQCTDIFLLRSDICQLGVDQRKVNMLAREYCSSVGIKNKPIILSHHMLMGLIAGQAKMSKSDPDSAVFMEDSPEDVRRKIMKASCPSEKEKKSAAQSELQVGQLGEQEYVLNNPVLDYMRYLIMENSKGRYSISIAGKTYDEADSIENDFIAGKISEQDLKEAVIKRLNEIMEGCRRHFRENKEAADLVDLVEQHKAEVKREQSSGVAKKTPLRSLKVFSCDSLGVVFATRPGPDFVVTVDAVLFTLKALMKASKQSHSKLVLWCEDWSCIALNKMCGDSKAIAAYFGVLTAAVQAMAGSLGTKLDFEVKYQSQEILRDPNMYWISVIDAGRKKRMDESEGEVPVIGLKEVEEHLPEGESFLESGQVVASLMHVADTLALCRGVQKTSLYTADAQQWCKQHTLAAMYLTQSFEGTEHAQEVCIPSVDAEEARKSADALNLVLGEGEPVLNSKMKKSYCLEGELKNNPMMDLLDLLIKCELLDMSKPMLEVKQKAEHGGDKTYNTFAEVQAAFESKELHPSAFKPAAQERVKQALAPLVALQKDASFKKLCTALDTFVKAQNKKGKK
eukprot:TRINITY_DN92093_c0_g1_i1.p1 TRINITY_DN92093_c0_g1~~TRINITY_DN92093_c0_g1_i1.p1  ORF type:complete len:770 (-),score=229.31 TRINITY_DN92093_c0_g1_i1:65-2374(-)